MLLLLLSTRDRDVYCAHLEPGDGLTGNVPESAEIFLHQKLVATAGSFQ